MEKKLVGTRSAKRAISLAALLAALIMSGCNPVRYTVGVNGLADPEKSALRSYVLLPSIEGVTTDDLQYREFAAYVERALASRGFSRVEDPKAAELVIFLAYGMGDPKEHHYSYSVPVYGQTGVASSYSSGTMTSYGNSAYYSGSTTYTPSYGVVGATTHTGSYSTCYRFMALDAVDVATYLKSQRIVPAWKLTAGSDGSTCDLRAIFPVLLGASMDLIGTNTGKTVVRAVRKRDEKMVRAFVEPSK